MDRHSARIQGRARTAPAIHTTMPTQRAGGPQRRSYWCARLAPRELVAAVWEAARKIGPMRLLQGRCTRRCASYTARVARLHSEQPLSHTRDRCVPSRKAADSPGGVSSRAPRIEPGASDRSGGKHRGFGRMGPIVTALPPYRSRIAPGAPGPGSDRRRPEGRAGRSHPGCGYACQVWARTDGAGRDG